MWAQLRPSAAAYWKKGSAAGTSPGREENADQKTAFL